MRVAVSISNRYDPLSRVPGGDLVYPTPWAATAETSFLATPEQTKERLEAAGFQIASLRDTTAEALEFGAKVRALLEAGGKAPHRAVELIHGNRAVEIAGNVGRGLKSGAIAPVEIICSKPA